MVAKHRRSEGEPSLMSAGAPVAAADDWPEAVGYGQASGAAWQAGMHSRVVRPGGTSYPAPTGYDGTPYGGAAYDGTGYDRTGYGDTGYGDTGYGSAAAEPGWAAAPDADVWQEWQDWRNWGPPPPMHPDHPSAPVPRVQLPADHPSAPMAALRDSGPAVLPQRRAEGSARTRSTPSQRSDAGYGNGRPRLHVVPDGETAGREATALRTPEHPGRPLPVRPPADLAEPDWQGDAFPRQQGLLHRDAVDNQRHAGPGWQEAAPYRGGTGKLRPGPGPGPVRGPGPGPGRFQSDRFPNDDSLWTARQVLTLADGQAAQIAQEAQDYAASIRAAAEREATAITQRAASEADAEARLATGQAAAIREAAEREAAEVRARLETMLGELSRVTAYVTEGLATSAMPATALAGGSATAPALPAVLPALPASTAPARPDTRPSRPGARPAMPGTRPSRTDTGPARPDAKPARPAERRPSPATKPQKQPRQHQAMRVASYATASLLLFSVIAGATEIGLHGFNFFVFRAGGVGQTAGNENDQQFLARQAAAAHHAATPKGRHAKKTHETVVVHKK